MTDYPANFRLPEWSGLRYTIKSGILRSVGTEAPEQRRQWKINRHEWSCRVILKHAEYGDWLTWVQTNGFAWFNIPAPAWLPGLTTAACNTIRARLISDIDVAQLGGDYVEVKFTMESAQ